MHILNAHSECAYDVHCEPSFTLWFVKYLKRVKVFRDLLLRGAKHNKIESQAESKEEDQSFEHLASNIRILTVAKKGTVLMEEGQFGDLFYIILDGKCEVLKASPCIIHSLTHDEDFEDKIPFYFRAFMENYYDIFWAGMDIS